MLNLFRNRVFLAVTSGHFAVDILNSSVAVLLAVLATPLKLTNGQIGLALTLWTLTGSLSQPLFGLLTDRMKLRPTTFAGLGVGWAAIGYGLVAFTQRWELVLLCLVLASLGSGLFHPIGTASASATNRERAGSATSLFFFSGQVGLSIGPLLGGWLFGRFGTPGMLPLAAFALLPVTLLLTTPAPPPALARAASSSTHTALRTAGILIAAFVVLVAVRSSIQQAYMSFLPKLFADREWDSTAYGALAGTFMFAAAIGNVLTGEVADRYGMRSATVWPLLLGVPAGLVCLWAPTPAVAFVTCAVAGLCIGGQHSVLVVHAQRLLPTKQGFAAGLILGFTFASGGVGTWLGGLAADVVGLPLVMQVITLLGLPCALLALTLPGREGVRAQVVGAEA